MVTVNENVSFTDYASGIRLPDCSKLVINRNKSLSVFLTLLFSLVKLSYWSMFYVNIITGSLVMTIFLHRGLTRNPEIGITCVCVLPNIWRLEQIRDIKFGTNVANKMLLNVVKAYSLTAFTVSQLLREN